MPECFNCASVCRSQPFAENLGKTISGHPNKLNVSHDGSLSTVVSSCTGNLYSRIDLAWLAGCALYFYSIYLLSPISKVIISIIQDIIDLPLTPPNGPNINGNRLQVG